MIRRRFKITKIEVTDLAVILAMAIGTIGLIYGFVFSVNGLFLTDYIIEEPETFNYAGNILRIILFILAITTLHTMIFAIFGFLFGLISGILLNFGFRFMSGIRYVAEE